MKFIVRLNEGEKVTDLSREFGISRKTAYKIISRYQKMGLAGLADQSRRPNRQANLMSPELCSVLLKMKREKPTWGAPKIRELFIRKFPRTRPPAISTIHSLFDRNGLVASRNRSRGGEFKAQGTYLSIPTQPNDLWCTDFKGHFPLGNKETCYPLTITDFVSRKIITIEAMDKINWISVKTAFQEAFLDHGMPTALRSDNGSPFASKGLFGLTQLSVWWLKLGIKLERIKPGCPQQNGRHERMHRTLKFDCTFPASRNLLAQQERFERFKDEFNNERPHQALDMKTPSDIYVNSSRQYTLDESEPEYEPEYQIMRVSADGTIQAKSFRVYLSQALKDQPVGLRQVDEYVNEVKFAGYKLGYFDSLSRKFSPAEDPFHWGAK